MEIILEKTNLFSGSDIKVLCKEAAMGPVDIFSFTLHVDS